MFDPTWHDMVRLVATAHHRHNLTDEQIEWLLWERTAFPFADPAYVLRQIDGFFE